MIPADLKNLSETIRHNMNSENEKIVGKARKLIDCRKKNLCTTLSLAKQC